MPDTLDDAPSRPLRAGAEGPGADRPRREPLRAERPTVKDDAGDGPVRPRRPARPTGTGPSRPWALIAVAVLGVIGTIGFGAAWRSASDRSSSGATTSQNEAAVRARARSFVLALTTFDGATIDESVAKLDAYGTGRFGTELSQFFSGKIRTQLKEARASSRGDIRSLYVESLNGDRARVFAVVDQTIANDRYPQPKADTLRLDIGLTRSGGAWKVFDLQTVGAGADAAATAGTGTTPTTR